MGRPGGLRGELGSPGTVLVSLTPCDAGYLVFFILQMGTRPPGKGSAPKSSSQDEAESGRAPGSNHPSALPHQEAPGQVPFLSGLPAFRTGTPCLLLPLRAWESCRNGFGGVTGFETQPLDSGFSFLPAGKDTALSPIGEGSGEVWGRGEMSQRAT